MDAVRSMMHDRFCDRLNDPTAMMDAFDATTTRFAPVWRRAVCSSGT
jgi:hypothetical protein